MFHNLQKELTDGSLLSIPAVLTGRPQSNKGDSDLMFALQVSLSLFWALRIVLVCKFTLDWNLHYELQSPGHGTWGRSSVPTRLGSSLRSRMQYWNSRTIVNIKTVSFLLRVDRLFLDIAPPTKRESNGIEKNKSRAMPTDDRNTESVQVVCLWCDDDSD